MQNSEGFVNFLSLLYAITITLKILVKFLRSNFPVLLDQRQWNTQCLTEWDVMSCTRVITLQCGSTNNVPLLLTMTSDVNLEQTVIIMRFANSVVFKCVWPLKGYKENVITYHLFTHRPHMTIDKIRQRFLLGCILNKIKNIEWKLN